LEIWLELFAEEAALTGRLVALLGGGGEGDGTSFLGIL
jgi:hypothetical protein